MSETFSELSYNLKPRPFILNKKQTNIVFFKKNAEQALL